MSIKDIEQLAQRHASARAALAGTVDALNEELDRIKRQLMPLLRRKVGAAKDTHAALKAAIEAEPHLFVKPRTITVQGIKCGLQKQKGSIKIADQDKTVELIERLYADDEPLLEQLLIVQKKPAKEGLEKLDAKALKKLGVEVIGDSDQVLIKDTTSDVDKLVAKLLEEDEEGAA